MSNHFYHERNFQQSRTHVLVRGSGGEFVGGVPYMVYAEYTLHADAYPCRYLPDGWGGEPYFDVNIDTLVKAQDVATAIGDAVWGALGTLGWQTDGVAVGSTAITRFHQGDLVVVDDPVEGQSDTVYPIRHVERVAGTTGHPIWEITVGDEPPDVLDLIRNITVIRPIQQALAAQGAGMGGGAGLGTQGMPGTPRQVPVSRTPTNSKAAVVMPQYNDTTGLTVRGNVQDRTPDTPALPISYAHPFSVTGPVTADNPDPAPGLWGSHDGEAHPYTVDFGYQLDGTYVTHVDYPMSMRRLSLKGTGTVTLQREGADVAGPYSVAAEWKNLLVTVDFLAGEDLGIVVTGTSGAGVSCKVKERQDTLVGVP